jgi:hypothetical protein
MKKFEKCYLSIESRCTRASIEATRQTVDTLPIFLKNGALALSETFASQRKQNDLATTGKKVLNSQMAITSSSYKDG